MKAIHRTYWLWLLIPLLAMPAAVLAGDYAVRAVREDHVPGEVLVKFKTGASPQAMLAAAKGVGAKHLRSFPRIGVRHWRLGKGLSVEKALEILAKRKNVEYAEPNYVVTANDMPNDPLRGDLWGLNNTGQTIDPNQAHGTPDADIDAPEAWDLATDASSVLVAVLDSGIEYTHEDLAANMWTNPDEIPGNGVDDDRNGIVDDIHGANFIGDGDPTGDPMDDYWHGTQIAGTIGAVGNNGIGVVGVCWKVQLMAVKCLDNVGSGTTTDVLEAIEYAASFNARVMNCSWGSGKRSKSIEAAVKASGALFVAAAGNSSSSRKEYPAAMALDNVIAVAATDLDDQLADFSNYGSWVHLAAPGVYVRSTGGLPSNVYGGGKSSTSRASAHVAGAAALAIAYLDGDNATVKAALLGGVDLIPSLTGAVSSGGRLNLFRTLGGTTSPPVGDTTPPAAVTDLAAGTATDFLVPLIWTATGDDGLVGTAYAYDLRYATTPITDEAAWGLADRASGEPIPQVTGSTESFVLEGLASLTTYYFALKVLDEVGNASHFSNVASATTLEAPWTTEVIASSGGHHHNRALDFYAGTGAGTFPVGCATSDGDTVVAVLWNGTAWQREVVDPDVLYGRGIDFAFAPDGTPTVSYGWGKIRFARRQADGTWKVESIDKGRAFNEYTALVYDPNTGEPTVAYRKGSKLQFARKVGGLNGSWQAETVDTAEARFTDMDYDRDGRPVIAYSDDHNGDGYVSALKVATRIGGDWVIETLHEGTLGYGWCASIAVDPTDGDLLIAHAGHSHIFAFRKTHGSSWEDAEAEDVGLGSDIHAVFRGDGTPFISCIRLGRATVTYHDGGAWQSERVADSARPRTDISRDPAGGLGVLYGRNSGGGGVGLGRQD